MEPEIKKLVDTITEFYKNDISLAYEVLKETMQREQSIPNKKNLGNIVTLFKECLISIIGNDIVRLSLKTFIYEFHQYRTERGLPAVENSSRAFNDYINEFNVNDIEKWFNKYPVLKDILSASINNDCAYVTKVFSDFLCDISDCKNLGLIKKEARLVQVSSSDSDPHNGGKRVLLFKFDSDEVMLYKPRSLSIDKLISDVFEKILNSGKINCDNPIPQVLDKTHYGWQKFVEKKSISISDIEQAYYNLGFCSAVFTILGSTDIHEENLIFKGITPYFIDLETGLSPQINYDSESIFGEMASAIFRTIVGTTIIPAKLAVSSYGILIGAINTPIKQKTRQECFNVINFGTDAVDIAKQNLEVDRIANPLIIEDDIINDPLPYQNIFSSGFRDGVKSISLNSDKIIGLLINFNSPIRYILRPTAKYYLILDAALFPENLVNFQKFTNTLNYLNSPKLVENPIISNQLFMSEKKSLSIGDIPSFYVLGDEKKLISQGFESDEIFDKTAITNAIEIIRGISENWKNLNERLIAEGFSYIREQSKGYLSSGFNNSDIFKKSLLKTKEIGYKAMFDTIMSMSIKTPENEKMGWLSGIYDDYPISYMSAIFCSLHDSGGILNLLEHHFGHNSNEYKMMKDGLVELGEILQANNLNSSIISSTESLEFLHTHGKTENPKLETILKNSNNIDGDVFLGDVGLYLVLSSYLKVDLKVLKQFRSISEKNPKFPKFGIAHGELGYLWTCFRIENKLNNRNSCNDIYEKVFSIYRTKLVNSLGWCNGLAGILMVLCEMSTILKKDQSYLYNLAEEITQLEKNSIDISICHGASGILQILLFVYKCTKDNKYLDLANKYWDKVLNYSIKYGFYTGEIGKDYLLGYFLGWSGFTDSMLLLEKFNNNYHAWIPINLSTNTYQDDLTTFKENIYESNGRYKSKI